MNLKEFFAYKNKLMEDLLTNEEIVRLLNEDPSGEINMDNAVKLAYEQVFPCEYVPDTVEHGKTYICFDVDITEVMNKNYLNAVLYIWVFTHKSLLRLPQGGIRTDSLCSEICEAINGSKQYGLGELELHSVKRFAPMTDYQGKVIAFKTPEINRLSVPNRPIPSKRR